jgi:heme iron utilization protein
MEPLEQQQQGGEKGAAARRLMRRCGHVALATNLDGRPYASLVAIAFALDGSPLLLLSDLAQHTRNLTLDPNISLLFADISESADPLASPRLSLVGNARRSDDPREAARFAARHPASAAYAGFGDFRLYRIGIERAHFVAGFGQIDWIAADALRLDLDASELAAAETEILGHMNSDHADAIALYAERLLGRGGGGAGWQITGIDPDGADLRRAGETARLDFHEPVLTVAAAQTTLVALARAARLR